MKKAVCDKYGRMLYDPEIHIKHLEPWTYKDQQYLIENYEKEGPEAVSFALGRTIHVVMTRAYQLRKEGLMPKRTTKKMFIRMHSKKGKNL